MKKSFSFYCDANDIGKVVLSKGGETRFKNQKRLLRFIRKHINSNKLLLKKIHFRKVQGHEGHPLRIRLEFTDPNVSEVSILLMLIQIYEFRQLLGRVYFGLPVQIPQDIERIVNYPVKKEGK